MAIFTFRRYLHKEPDEYESFELDSNGEQKYSQKIHDGIHYATYEIECIIEVDTDKGSVEIIEIRDGNNVFRRANA